MPITEGYTINHRPAFAGQVADGELKNVISKLNTAEVTIPYGHAVVRDGDHGAKPVETSSVAEDFVGVVVYEKYRATKDDEQMGAVSKKDMSVLNMGVIYVKVLEEVAQGDAVFMRVGATDAGLFCKSAGSGETASVELEHAKFKTSAKANTLVQISLNLGV